MHLLVVAFNDARLLCAQRNCIGARATEARSEGVYPSGETNRKFFSQ